MKQLILLLTLIPFLGFSQQTNEAGSLFEVELGSTPILSPQKDMPAFDFGAFVNAQTNGCSERERAIRHARVDIECFSLTPEELGFQCDSSRCKGGVHDAFIAQQSIFVGHPECEYIVKVIPSLPRLPVGNVTRGNEGNELLNWMFVCKQCEYKRGEILILD